MNIFVGVFQFVEAAWALKNFGLSYQLLIVV
jgi:hypothetical protein